MEINKIFGAQVFNDEAMRSRMPERVYHSLKATNLLGKTLDPDIADVVATAMKDWAVSMGATHYTHWFQPLNNMSAGKHDSFISHSENGKLVTEFSSAALVRGEPDASSFPSGGLRATFEARGYTAWDPSSPAFVRDGTLYIPTAFCSYTGEALDAKTPLLRSMQALAPQALRVLRALGNTSSEVVTTTVGAEQEYFLIDRELYEKRLDLKLCGRTLMGARPPKGQELDDHYCGRIRLRVAEFMRDLDDQLWRLGIPSKTKHNEAAPAQHELAPIYETVNIACDHNLLTMELMRVTAKKHGLACLLHEKPFDGVNGSGKHNNFSISTDDGINFLNPGKNPEENSLFLLTLCALIESVDDYADLLRVSTAIPGNDARLGGCEAPPAIISIFLGDPLKELLENIAHGIHVDNMRAPAINTGVDILPRLKKDDNDRNRTSAFAFTGNKFEFRMLGSSQSIAFCNCVLNTAMADVFSRFASRLENCANLEMEIANIISDTLRTHGRVIFNGNNYDPEWARMAEKMGLPVLRTSLDAIERMNEPKNIELFSRHGIFTEAECHARYEIMLENYEKIALIEADTMLQMVRREVFPAALGYLGQVSGIVLTASGANVPSIAAEEHAAKIRGLVDETGARLGLLAAARADMPYGGISERVCYARNKLRPAMQALREVCDEMETFMQADKWPIPTYTDLLHRI